MSSWTYNDGHWQSGEISLSGSMSEGAELLLGPKEPCRPTPHIDHRNIIAHIPPGSVQEAIPFSKARKWSHEDIGKYICVNGNAENVLDGNEDNGITDITPTDAHAVALELNKFTARYQ